MQCFCSGANARVRFSLLAGIVVNPVTADKEKEGMKMRSRWWSWWSGCALIAGLALAVTSCGRKTEEKPTAVTQPQPERPQEQFLVAYAQSNMAETWRQAQWEDAQEELKNHPELKVELSDAKQDNLTQIQNVKNHLAKGIDLLIVCPNEAEALTPVVGEAYDSGIPVVVVDRAILNDKYTVFVGGDNYEIGKMAGEFIAKRLNGKGNVVEIEGQLGAPPTKLRSQGMHDVIKDYPDIKVVYKQTGEYLRMQGKEVMKNALQASPDIDCVYAHNDEMILGAYQAAAEVGRGKEMIFIGVDGQKEVIESIRDGKITATYYYPTCGKEAIQIAARLLAGEQLDKDIMLHTIEITQENAEKNMHLGF